MVKTEKTMRLLIIEKIQNAMGQRETSRYIGIPRTTVQMFGNVLYQTVALMTTKEADVQQKQMQEIERGWFWNVRGTRSLPRQNCAVVPATCHISP